MRAGLSTIQQTLTPEAASVLNHSIAEAGRRNHGQTTPLHVAATLLTSPSGFLRQACIRSHPNSSHPLQCRALELCFSVALERLPTAQNMSPGMEPPISNALMAALKRAQAHQRRGCPEQQQQPLLAVKVELNQLIISILDDPSVSRVMREASFSSPAVKATIEQSLNSQAAAVNSSTFGIGLRPTTTPTPLPMPVPTPMPTRNLYLNPRLQQGNSGQHRNEEVKRIIDILLRTNKGNPILVGESEPEAVLKELLRRIENGEFDEGPLKNVQVMAVEKELASDKTQIPVKMKELWHLIESQTKNSDSGGIVLDLGDLKWLVEKTVCTGAWGSGGAPQQVVSETERMFVGEMGKLLAKSREGGNCKLWLIGTATCETYLRCQVYHPSMENDWDLQAVPITSRSTLPGMFPRLGTKGILSRSDESRSPLKNFPTITALPKLATGCLDPTRRLSCCPQCKENYEQELAVLVSKEFETEVERPPLPQWLQNARIDNSYDKTSDKYRAKDQEMIFKQRSQELQKKWSDKCLLLHPNFHHNPSYERSAPVALLTSGLYNPNPLLQHPFQPKMQQTRKGGETMRLKPNLLDARPLARAGSPPGSPVRTELVLGRTKTAEADTENTRKNCVQHLLDSFSSEPQCEKFASSLDADLFKKLLKSLMEKVWWQREAASAVATTVTQCKLGNGKGRGAGSKGDIWLLFTGPDRVGKKKMASILSEQVCGANPIMISLGSGRDSDDADANFRGKTALDRIVEAVRRNPFSVIMLEKIDEADMLVRGSIKRAMERGRLADTYGREISLGNVIFILTANSFPDDLKNSPDGHLLDEKYLASVSSGGWQLRLSVGEKNVKRQAKWLLDRVHRPAKPRKEMGSNLSLDLNLAVDTEDDRTDGSNNSSDLTIDHEGGEHGLDSRHFSITSLPHDLVKSLDDTIFFNRVDAATIRRGIENAIADKFSSAMDHKLSIEVEEEALEKILGGIWLGNSSLDEWSEKVLVPSFHQLRANLPSTIFGASGEAIVVRLQLDSESQRRSSGDWLPCNVTVTVDGA